MLKRPLEETNCINSLVCFAQTLKGLHTTVDLRNDSYVTGQIDQVDGYMNIVMGNCIFTDSSGNEAFYMNLFVKERSIRYIHIPESVNIQENLKRRLLPRQEKKYPKLEKPSSFKQKKLLIRNEETKERVRMILENKKKIKEREEASKLQQ